MQPYLFPYIGYFQLLAAVDSFVVYDNIEYCKKGWVNRNRILVNGQDAYFTAPLQKDSDSKFICERNLVPNFALEHQKVLRRIREAYRRAPHFETVFSWLTSVFDSAERNLFGFLHHTLLATRDFLEIQTPVTVSSRLSIDHTLRSQDKVLALCHGLAANQYLNPIGGQELYDRATFTQAGIELQFLQSTAPAYPQFGGEFVPWLSIIDVLMFNGKDQTRELLGNYRLA